MMKHWQEHYGAELMYMTGVEVDMYVSHPPQDRESALRLAWEHFAYRHETIGEIYLDIETLEDLAARQLNSSLWYFWWD